MTPDIVERLRACLRFDEPNQSESALEQAAREAAAEIERLRAALAELVACKDMSDALSAWRPGNAGDAAIYHQQKGEYERRKPAAWDAARAALEKP